MVGTILLTRADQYVTADGKLPKRPEFDKELLTAICKDGLVSHEAFNMLPRSITRDVSLADDFLSDITVPITIKELAQADLLIVSRSEEVFEDGKTFRFDNFKCLVKDTRIELWVSIK